MPWKETSAMEQRIQLIADWLSGEYGKSELCRIYEISRPTADKWIGRYERGVGGLAELGRAPQRHPNQTAEELRALIVQTKLSASNGVRKRFWTGCAESGRNLSGRRILRRVKS